MVFDSSGLTAVFPVFDGDRALVACHNDGQVAADGSRIRDRGDPRFHDDTFHEERWRNWVRVDVVNPADVSCVGDRGDLLVRDDTFHEEPLLNRVRVDLVNGLVVILATKRVHRWGLPCPMSIRCPARKTAQIDNDLSHVRDNLCHRDDLRFRRAEKGGSDDLTAVSLVLVAILSHEMSAIISKYFCVISLKNVIQIEQQTVDALQTDVSTAHILCCIAHSVGFGENSHAHAKKQNLSPIFAAQQLRLSLAVAEYQILGSKHFLSLGLESGKIWWLNKVQYLQKKYHCRWTLLRGRQPKWIFHNFGDVFHNHLSSYRSRVSEWFQRNGKSDQFLEIVYRRQKWFQVERHRIGNLR